MGRRNLSGAKIAKESYEYYAKNFAAQKSYYRRKGYTELIPLKMNREEWEFKKAKTGMSNKDIIYDEFHKYSRKSTESLVAELRRRGFKVSKAAISRGELTAAQWAAMKQDYRNAIAAGRTVKEARSDVAAAWWGS